MKQLESTNANLQRQLSEALAIIESSRKPLNMIELMRDAQIIVKGKFVWKRFIDGNPLNNDIAVWMAEFAYQNYATVIQEGMVKDAERYRFLRRVSNEPELMDFLNVADEEPETPEAVDADIDKAMLSAVQVKSPESDIDQATRLT